MKTWYWFRVRRLVRFPLASSVLTAPLVTPNNILKGLRSQLSSKQKPDNQYNNDYPSKTYHGRGMFNGL